MINKIDLREMLQIPILTTDTMEETFQNQTLRPVLKLQNDLYWSLFTKYVIRQNTDFDSLSITKKCNFIELSLKKDNVLKNIFIGITIGMFTLQELDIYTSDSKEFNRRIIKMLIERIQSQIK